MEAGQKGAPARGAHLGGETPGRGSGGVRGAGSRPPGPHRGGRRKPRSVPPHLCQGPEFESHLHPIRPHHSWLDEQISPLPIPYHTPTGTQFILQTSRGSGRPKRIAIFQPSQAALKTKALFFYAASTGIRIPTPSKQLFIKDLL